MKAMLIAIFRAMQRKKLGEPSVKTSANTFRTNNVVQMDRRTGGTATGRKATLHPAVGAPYKASNSTIQAENAAVVLAREDGYDWARRSCESAWPQPSFNTPEQLAVVGEAETTKFASGGGSFDGGGSSGDWSSGSNSSDSGSSSCDSGSSSSSSGCD